MASTKIQPNSLQSRRRTLSEWLYAEGESPLVKRLSYPVRSFAYLCILLGLTLLVPLTLVIIVPMAMVKTALMT